MPTARVFLDTHEKPGGATLELGVGELDGETEIVGDTEGVSEIDGVIEILGVLLGVILGVCDGGADALKGTIINNSFPVDGLSAEKKS